MTMAGAARRLARTRVKICGLTRADDACAAMAAGADALGLVFYLRSPRCVDVERARAVTAGLPPFVTVVGLFVDAPADEVRAVLEAVRIDLLQFHGEEPPEYCAGFPRPYIKALRMREGLDLRQAMRAHRRALGLLLDAYSPAAPGGSGLSFDWDRVPADLPVPVILAGGLTPENVGAAVRRVRPFAVDVSSGVESAPGIKDPDRVRRFLEAVRRADAD